MHPVNMIETQILKKVEKYAIFIVKENCIFNAYGKQSIHEIMCDTSRDNIL